MNLVLIGFLILTSVLGTEAMAEDPNCVSVLSAQIQDGVVQEIADIVAAEEVFGVPEIHRTQFFLQQKDDRIIKTPLSVVVTHGLLNSPAWMKWMAERAYALGFNVINVRLPGHYHRNRRQTDQFDYHKAIENNLRMATLAGQLGTKTVYIGHSVGGALSLLSAMEHKDKTAGLVLFSPALKVHLGARYLSRFLSYLGISGWIKDGLVDPANNPRNRYLSTYAGVQVDLLTRHLSALSRDGQSSDEADAYARVRHELSDLPILWLDTALDIVIDGGTNQRLAQSLARTEHRVLPWNLGIVHDAVVQEPKQDGSNISRALEEFTSKWTLFLETLAESN